MRQLKVSVWFWEVFLVHIVYITPGCLSLTKGQRSSPGVLQHACRASSLLHNCLVLLAMTIPVKQHPALDRVWSFSPDKNTQKRFNQEQKMHRNTHQAQTNAKTMHSSMHESHTHRILSLWRNVNPGMQLLLIWKSFKWHHFKGNSFSVFLWRNITISVSF